MMRNVCYARTHAGRQAQARAHTHCCEIIRALGSRERKRETRRRAAAPPILKRQRERQRLEQELGGEITAVLKKYFIAELQKLVGIATSSV